MQICLNEAELVALDGLPLLAQCLYVFAIKPRIDLRTNLVGIKPRISWQALREWLYVEPHSGVLGGSPSKQQIRRAAEWLEKTGLVTFQSRRQQLIFKCLLANQDKFVQNKADIFPTERADRVVSSKSPLNKGALELNLKTSRQFQIAEADTHSNYTKQNYTISSSLVSSYQPEAIPQQPEEWVAFFVEVLQFSRPVTHTTQNIILFESWCGLRLSIAMVKQAIAVAETQLGHRPDTPTYYRSFVESLLHHKKTFHPKSHQPQTKRESHYAREPKRKSAAQRMWESCQEGLKGTDFDPNYSSHH